MYWIEQILFSYKKLRGHKEIPCYMSPKNTTKLNDFLMATGLFLAILFSVCLSVMQCVQVCSDRELMSVKYLLESWRLIGSITIVVWGINWFLLSQNQQSKNPLGVGKKIAFILMSMSILILSLKISNFNVVCLNTKCFFFNPISFEEWWTVFTEKWIFVSISTLYIYLPQMAFVTFLFNSNVKIPYLPRCLSLIIFFSGIFCMSHAAAIYIVTALEAMEQDGIHANWNKTFLENQSQFVLETVLPALAYAGILIWGIHKRHKLQAE